MTKLLLLATSVATFSIFVAATAACSSANTDSDGPGKDGGADRARLKEPFRPDASCPVVIESPELLPATHVTEDQNPEYNSNPPSSGPHYLSWAHYKEFDAPVKRGYLVHSLEHGGVVLSYKCEGAACAPIQEGLRKIRDGVPADNRCDPSIRARVVIVPDPLLDVPVAAAGWGWTYKAQCVDAPTLQAFANDHYGQGPEDTCAPGKSTF